MQSTRRSVLGWIGGLAAAIPLASAASSKEPAVSAEVTSRMPPVPPYRNTYKQYSGYETLSVAADDYNLNEYD